VPKSNQIIRNLIRENKIKEAVAHLDAIDSDMSVLLQRELSEHEQHFALGVISLKQKSQRRSNISHRILSYLKIYAASSQRVLAESIDSNLTNPEDNAPQNFILPIEKTLIQQHLGMEKPVYLSSPKIMTFYFLEQKEHAITAALECLEQYREDGYPTIIRLLSTLRELADPLRELYDVLLSSGFREDPLTLATRKCADLCGKLRRELTPATLKKDSVRSDIEDAEILLSRILRQIKKIKSTAERFSES
jgi:hypothetical protein